MKYIIIGSKGFIGSYTTRYFSENHEVWECDVVTDYVNPRYFIVDATNSDYSEIFASQRFDVCINCSGAASVPASLENPQRDYQLNTVNVYKLLDAIRKYNPKCRFLNLSSAAVYGNPKSLPIHENQEINPMSPYGYHKRAAEILCKEFTQFFKLETCNLRIFSTYGDGLKKQIFWDLFHKIQQSDVLDLFGTGKESRDFIHVSDLVKQIELAINHSSFQAEVINSANGKQIYIEDAVKTFVEVLNWNGEINFIGKTRKGDPLNWVADISLMKDYGYKQQISFGNGIKKYLEWAKESK